MPLKTFNLEPSELLYFLQGVNLGRPAVKVSDDARVTRSGFNKTTGEFWMDVEAASFDDRLLPARLPQDFKIVATP